MIHTVPDMYSYPLLARNFWPGTSWVRFRQFRGIFFQNTSKFFKLCEIRGTTFLWKFFPHEFSKSFKWNFLIGKNFHRTVWLVPRFCGKNFHNFPIRVMYHDASIWMNHWFYLNCHLQKSKLLVLERNTNRDSKWCNHKLTMLLAFIMFYQEMLQKMIW